MKEAHNIHAPMNQCTWAIRAIIWWICYAFFFARVVLCSWNGSKLFSVLFLSLQKCVTQYLHVFANKVITHVICLDAVDFTEMWTISFSVFNRNTHIFNQNTNILDFIIINWMLSIKFRKITGKSNWYHLPQPILTESKF